jgi:peptidoglycan hydrolase CwlO-like protein
METNQTTAGNKKVFIAAIIVLAIMNATTGYFLFSENHNKKELAVQKAKVEQNYSNLEGEYHTVTASLDAASVEIGQLKGKNTELDKIITEKQEMIDQTKKDLDESYAKNTLTSIALNKARTMITRYESSIAELQKKVDEFTEENHHLTAKNEKLNTDLECEKETTTELTTKTQDLSQKLETASYLNIPNVEVAAVKKNLRGNEVTTSKAKAAESLKISFETGVNKALEPGKLSLFVRIINPKGETIAVKEQGSGVITAENEKTVQYTKKADINYNQKNKQVVMYWARYIETPGTYRVEVYQGGKVVGRGAVRLA